MATMFLDNGSATGYPPVGNGKVVIVYRGNTPDLLEVGYKVVDKTVLDSLGPYLKIVSGTLVSMTAAEIVTVQENIASKEAAKAAAAASKAANKTAAMAELDSFKAHILDENLLTTKELLLKAAKALVFLLEERNSP